MRRIVLLAAFVAAASLVALPAQGAGQSLYGDVRNAAGSTTFSAGHIIIVDAFSTTSRDRYSVVWETAGLAADPWQIPVPADTYRVRTRVWNPAGTAMVAYQWSGGGTTYESGTNHVVPVSTDIPADTTVPTFTGGTFSGSVTPTAFDDGVPTDLCVSVMPVEATSGIGLGWLSGVDEFGAIGDLGPLPPGSYRALAWWAPSADPACDPATRLGSWYGGGAFGPLDFTASGMARLPGFGLGSAFTIAANANTPNVDFKLDVLPKCFGRRPTIFGTDLAEEITGTNGLDVILALGGSDTIHGLDGSDRICAGDGHDLVYGGRGHDRIGGGPGHDYVYGGSGNDIVRGGAGDDTMHGQKGDDSLRGDSGFDWVYGGIGVDICIGEFKNNCEG